jgi:Na+-transporting NADH:ubiquinone oxidoreductase subunit NqrB
MSEKLNASIFGAKEKAKQDTGKKKASRAVCHLFVAGFSLGLLFNPEDESSMFL